MTVRAQDLPELRAEVLTWQQRHGARYFTSCLRAGAQTSYQPLLSTADEGHQLARAETARLTEAELFWVSPEMTELTVAAARSMPAWSLEPEDLPAPSGLIYFDGLPTARPEFPTTAMAWGPCPPEMATPALKNSGLWLSCYVDRNWVTAQDGLDLSHMQIPLGPLVYDGESLAAYGEREAGDIAFMSDAGRIVEVDDETFINKCSSLVVLKAASLLMRQELAEDSAVEVDRAARKRLRRAGHEPAPVRVIELRRPKTANGTPGESGREYHHRWITRGHWRQQWHPARQVHRPIWIAPHIKGPEGAPLIGGEKVYALKR